MKHLHCVVLFSLSLLLQSSVSAQITKKAQAGFRFLENPIAAEVIARGSAGVTTTMNANGIFWNPALLGWAPGTVDLALNRTQGIADINYNALGAAVHLWETGVLGISLISMDYGTFYGTRLSSNEQGYEETGTFSPKAYALGVAFAQKVSDRFSYGVHLKYASQDLGSAWVGPTGGSLSDPALAISQRNYQHGEYALDVGAFYDFLYKGIRFGASLQNLSREIKYENEAFPMPFAINFGVTVQPLEFFLDGKEAQALVLIFESRHPRDFEEKVKFGAEYNLFDAVIGRIGYMKNFDERGFTAGLGLRHVVGDFPLRADYAYEAFGIFGAVHHFTLAVTY